MKTLSALIALILSQQVLATPAEDFKTQFGEFVGKYKVVSCSQAINRPGKPVELNTICDRTDAEIFFGSNYRPADPFDGLFMTMHKESDKTSFAGTGLAEFNTDPNEFCATAHGIQTCENPDHEYSIRISLLRSADGVVHLHWTLIWGPTVRGGMINDLYLDIKPEVNP